MSVMKGISVIILSFIASISTGQTASADTFDIYRGDTINRIDKFNMKQGHWIEFHDIEMTKKKVEGYYEDDKKVGSWKEWFNNGQLKYEIDYQNNWPFGNVIFYYKNGNPQEKGTWQRNKWVGLYEYFFESGNLAYQWKYNEKGLRSGVQKYFYENGNVMVEGEWINGQESGKIKEYWSNGKLRSVKTFIDGIIIPQSIVNYNEQGEIIEDPSDEIITTDKLISDNQGVKQEDAVNKIPDGQGVYKVRKGSLIVEINGIFIDGRLKEGSKTYLGANEKVIKKEIYQDFNVINITY